MQKRIFSKLLKICTFFLSQFVIEIYREIISKIEHFANGKVIYESFWKVSIHFETL